ncbi:MAG: 50S ribosomal protein L29 [Nitrososphaerota archaeon]|nr:50S ribosomal protein L29 [Candidatus Calditenuaceae archaeon]MDW8072950.1 50S ribosomal protein L29 [Nitrososphaerota archaeon]
MVKEVKQLREKSLEELDEELEAARTELRNVKIKLSMAGQGENTANIRNLRKRIARIMTIMKEKQLEEG